MTRYDILLYTVDTAILNDDEITKMAKNDSYLFEHYCNDLCDDVIYTSLHDTFAKKVFFDTCKKVKIHNGYAYVYVLCMIKNNDIYTVLDYSKN